MDVPQAQAVLAMTQAQLLPMELVSAGLYENATVAQQASNTNAQAAATANASLTTANQTIATLQSQLATANAQIAALQSQISGTTNTYQITVSAVEEAALEIQAQQQGTTVQAVVIDLWNAAIVPVGDTHATAIQSMILAKYATVPTVAQNQLLTLLGLGQLIGMPLAGQMPILQTMGDSVFRALPTATQGQIMAALK
jgi:hypothetical protein